MNSICCTSVCSSKILGLLRFTTCIQRCIHLWSKSIRYAKARHVEKLVFMCNLKPIIFSVVMKCRVNSRLDDGDNAS